MCTVAPLARRLRATEARLECEITLACGDVLPQLELRFKPEGQVTHVTIGGPATGEVVLQFRWTADGTLALVEVDHFFYEFHLTPAYRTALAARTARTAPHVFMLLVDELVYHAMSIYGAAPRAAMTLDDVADLDGGAGSSPFALRGRTAFYAKRNSRFLQWARGVGYYVTFGYWPACEDPPDYLTRRARFSRSGVVGESALGVAPGDPDYQATLLGVRQLDALPFCDVSVRELPPTLPPLSPDGPLRTFADMDDFFERVIRVGEYGKAVGRPRPPVGREPAVVPAAPKAALDLRPVGVDEVLGSSAVGPVMVEGVPAPEGVRAFVGRDGRSTVVLTNAYTFHTSPDGVTVTGRLDAHVRAVVRLAERLAERLGAGPGLAWEITASDPQHLVVGGRVFKAPDGTFVAPGAQHLVDLGLVPVGRPTLLAQARAADQETGGALIGRQHPRYPHYVELAKELRRDRWERPTAGPTAPLKRAREPQFVDLTDD